jgi:hypothetical protein
MALVLIAACSRPHVNLALPPNPSPEDRVQAFTALHATGEDTEITSTCRGGGGCSTNIEKTLHLANGTDVYHADDLLPVVSDDSPTAQSVRAMHNSRSKQTRYGLYALGSFVAFVVIAFQGFSASDGGGMPLPYKLGMVGTGVGALVFAYGSYHYHWEAADHWGQANRNFNQSLAQRLNVCVVGLGVVPCEQGDATRPPWLPPSAPQTAPPPR